MAPKLVYFVQIKELLNFSETAPSITKSCLLLHFLNITLMSSSYIYTGYIDKLDLSIFNNHNNVVKYIPKVYVIDKQDIHNSHPVNNTAFISVIFIENSPFYIEMISEKYDCRNSLRYMRLGNSFYVIASSVADIPVSFRLEHKKTGINTFKL